MQRQRLSLSMTVVRVLENIVVCLKRVTCARTQHCFGVARKSCPGRLGNSRDMQTKRQTENWGLERPGSTLLLHPPHKKPIRYHCCAYFCASKPVVAAVLTYLAKVLFSLGENSPYFICLLYHVSINVNPPHGSTTDSTNQVSPH